MPLFEGCCTNLPIDRKQSAAYTPSRKETNDQFTRINEQKAHCPPMSPSTSDHITKENNCHVHRETNENENNSSVRFREGLSTGSTEMLHATNFYQNCVDEDTESRWMEVFEEQKAIGQASSDSILTAGNDQETEVIISKSVTTIEMGNPKINTDSTFLEKTHSAETKIDGKFRTSLQRCHEMENIDKVAYQ